MRANQGREPNVMALSNVVDVILFFENYFRDPIEARSIACTDLFFFFICLLQYIYHYMSFFYLSTIAG